MASTEIPVAEALLEILESEGVEYIFGVPGGPLTGLFEAMADRKKIRLVLAKHEGGAAYMAASYARVRRGLAVCCGTSGPGATNALTGIAGANADSLPVLLLTGQVSTGVFGKGAIQESSVFGLDLVSLFRPVTKLSAMLPSVERAPDTLRAAIRTALTGRPGAVHLSMPADIIRRPVRHTPLAPHQYRSESVAVDTQAIQRAAQLLVAAKKPCVIAGHGVALADAASELTALAHALHVPVATSPKGKGVFPENDKLSLGVLGFGGHERAEQYVQSEDVDVILVVGSSLNEFVTNGWTIALKPSTALIQVDIDATVIARNYPVHIGVASHALPALKALRAEVEKAGPAVRDRDPLRGLRQTTPRHLSAESMNSDALPLKPQRVIQELREVLPTDAQLFVETGNSIIWATHYFEVRAPHGYFVDLGMASMGAAVAGVVGGAMAAPHKKSIALVGDAAFAMNGFEVHTAVEQGLPIVWVVLNNGGHGMVRQGDLIMKGRDLGVSAYRVPLDAAAMARSVGARGARVETPHELRGALRAALDADRPTVIDVLIDPDEIAPTLFKRVETLARSFALSRKTDPPPPRKSFPPPGKVA